MDHVYVSAVGIFLTSLLFLVGIFMPGSQEGCLVKPVGLLQQHFTGFLTPNQWYLSSEGGVDGRCLE